MCIALNIKMSEEVPCFFQAFCSSPCHKVSLLYNGKSKLIPVKSMTQRDQDILWRRAGASPTEDVFICSYHHALLVTKFQFLQKTCCNPFGKDKVKKRKGLQPITSATATKLQELTERFFQPGQKLCPGCRVELKKRKNMQIVEFKEFEYDNGTGLPLETTNKENNSLGESPLREGERDSLDSLNGKVKRAKIGTSDTTVVAVDITPAEVTGEHQVEKCRKSRNLDILISELKAKFRESQDGMRLQILTLTPSSWTVEETAKEFECSTKLVKQARKLKMEVGILGIPEKRKRKLLTEDIKKRVLDFYENDEFSRLCPGKKDFVSLRIDGQRVQKQKRLLLCNLKEIYLGYVKQYGSEIGFSQFCELKPKWCFTMGASRAQSVCVCVLHQNVKLMLAAATPIQDDYKELLKKTVCSLESRNCMTGSCEECPGEAQLKFYLKQAFKEHDPAEILEFKQWIYTYTLGTISSTMEDFIKEFTEKITDLKTHHYVSKHQSQYLKKLKETRLNKEVIVLMDFSENFSFITEDESQAIHWNKTQATVHPVVVYIPGRTLRCLSLCMISDSLNHNIAAVYTFQQKLIEHLKLVLGKITRIHYFSTGSQYKNSNNFINLCFHEQDFGISAEWNFFGTNHGKSSCDGIGGTVKRLAGHACLQKTNQILTPQDLFNYCDGNILGIKFFYVSREDIKAFNGPQEKRFSNSRTLTETNEYHQFKPMSKDKIKVSRLSGDKTSQIIKLF